MAALLLPVALLSSCGDDDNDSLSLDKTSMTLNYKATGSIEASEKNCNWTSDNEFVATVDAKGKVTAKHVGTARITATKDGESASCTVTVNQTVKTYDYPFMTWGASKDAVKKASTDRTLDTEDSESLFYTTMGNLPWYIYSFSSKGLDGASITVAADRDDAFMEQLVQSYATVEDSERPDDITLCNGNSLSEATIEVINVELSDGSQQYQFLPIVHTKALYGDKNEISARLAAKAEAKIRK